MGRTCCVIGCNARSHDHKERKLDNGLSFYGFPSWKQLQGSLVSDITKRRRMAWIAAVRRPDIKFVNIPRYLKVCSQHFHMGKPAYEMEEAHPDWAPSLHLGHSDVHVTQQDRYLRIQQRLKGRINNQADEHMAEDGQDGENAEIEVALEEEEDGAEVEATEEEEDGEQAENEDAYEPAAKKQQTYCPNCDQIRAEINHLLQENRELRSELSKRQFQIPHPLHMALQKKTQFKVQSLFH
ncbi:hypothetical protein JOB18_014977 [Solea senegalensis]|uniref:THAP-type domain-containing protein n=1 Tax=Solea senegalensis TaxID=28829 RepID=A0AAV6R735_SOLSE|nr:uncharacterized protein LOC122786947 [Solea senegalensis]KAG7500314.1 hypothetical protein JOB18_014977 [Solea senegalensis]